MAFEADDLAAIRDHVGTEPSDEDVQTAWERLGTVEAVAVSVLRRRLADMLARPLELAVDGDYRESFAKNVDALRAKVRELEGAVASGVVPGVVVVTHLTRSGRSR